MLAARRSRRWLSFVEGEEAKWKAVDSFRRKRRRMGRSKQVKAEEMAMFEEQGYRWTELL